jgi:hypothetical protein
MKSILHDSKTFSKLDRIKLKQIKDKEVTQVKCSRHLILIAPFHRQQSNKPQGTPRVIEVNGIQLLRKGQQHPRSTIIKQHLHSWHSREPPSFSPSIFQPPPNIHGDLLLPPLLPHNHTLSCSWMSWQLPTTPFSQTLFTHFMHTLSKSLIDLIRLIR